MENVEESTNRTIFTNKTEYEGQYQKVIQSQSLPSHLRTMTCEDDTLILITHKKGASHMITMSKTLEVSIL